MFRVILLSLGLLCFSSSAPCQIADPQTKTMEAVLSEIRQLRQDLRAAAIATRKAQIVIYRLHVQQGVLERTMERRDNVKDQLAQLQNQKKYQADQIAQLEEMSDKAATEQMRQQYAGSAERLRSELGLWAAREQELQTELIELETELRTERGKWEYLEAELDRLENSLESTTLQADNRR